MTSDKEIAFIREHFINDNWTECFTKLVDEHLKFDGENSRILYAECGTGNHLLALREKLPETTEIAATESHTETLNIAKAKVQAIRAKILFENNLNDFPDEVFTDVLFDATFSETDELKETLEKLLRVADEDGDIAFFLPTAGSFGEIFSVLWETLYESGLLDYNEQLELLIEALPKITAIEEITKKAGLKDVNSWTNIETYDFETSEQFLASPLVNSVFLPKWLSIVPEGDREEFRQKFAQILDKSREDLSFQMSVKATLVVGKKVL